MSYSLVIAPPIFNQLPNIGNLTIEPLHQQETFNKRKFQVCSLAHVIVRFVRNGFATMQLKY